MQTETKQQVNTHHWHWSLEVHNAFRNSTGRISYQWYGPLAIYRGACWAAGPAPTKPATTDCIRIRLRGAEVSRHTSKDEAFAAVRQLVEKAPPVCRDYAVSELWALRDAVYGNTSH